MAVLGLLAGDLFVEPSYRELRPAGAQEAGDDGASASELPPLGSQVRPAEEPIDADFWPVPDSGGGRPAGWGAAPDAGFQEGESVVVESETTEDQLVYENPDGSFTAELSTSPVRFEDEAGEWHDYDTDVIREGGELVPEAAPEGDSIALVAEEEAVVSAETDLGVVSLGHPGAEPVRGQVDGNEVTYPGAVEDGSDLVVSLLPDGFETTVVVPDASGPSSFEQVLMVPEGVVARDGGVGVELVGPSGAVVGSYGSGLAYDSAARPAEAEVRTDLVGQDGTAVTVRVSVAEAWFSDPARAFPVEIDPVFTQKTSQSGTLDTFVQSNIVNTPQSSSTDLKVGPIYGQTSVVRRALFRFDVSSLVGSNRQVTEATLGLVNTYAPSCTARPVQVRSLGGPFNDSTVWSNQPGFGGTTITSEPFAHGYNSSCPGAGANIDIQELAQKWINGSANHGLALKAVDESDGLAGKTFLSGEVAVYAPTLTITYNRPPSAGVPLAPATGTKVPTTQPLLELTSGTDPDGDSLRHWFSVATEPDGQSGSVVKSGWLSPGVTQWRPPAGSLVEGATYYWTVSTWDGTSWPVVAPTPRSFTVDLRLGDTGLWAFDEHGPAKVNLTTGNAVASTSSPTFPTVAGDMGLSYGYNSRAESVNGLTGSYFDVAWSATHEPGTGQEPAIVRRDPAVSFSWGAGKPASQVGTDNFYVQWTGFLTIPNEAAYTGGYSFGGTCDDGMRIKVNGTTVLDKWTGCGTSPVWSAVSNYTAGQVVPITVESWEGVGSAGINLMMRNPVNADSNGTNIPSSWLSTKATTLPTGWTVSADLGGTITYRSAEKTDEAITFIDLEGGAHRYTWNAMAESWTPPEGEFGSVGAAANGAITLIDEDGQTYVFDTTGALTSVTSALDASGQASLQHTWSGKPARLTAITDPVSGRSITLHYSGDPACTAAPGFVTAPTGMLCAVSYEDFSAGTTQLRYVKAGSSYNLARLEDPGAEVTDFAYDANGRLTKLRDPLAAEAVAAGVRADDDTTRTIIAYGPDGKVGSITLPAPLVGEARPTHTYTYVNATTTDVGATGLTSTTGRLRRVTFDADGRTLTDADQAGRTDHQAWDDEDRIIATWNSATGLKSTTVYDTRGLAVETWGPAPTAWWLSAAAGGAPTSNVAQTPHATTTYDGGIVGLAATWWSNPTWSGPPAAWSTGINPSTPLSYMDWGAGSPAGVAADFSGRITGWLRFDNTSPWNLAFSSLRGAVKLTVDNALVIDAASTTGEFVSGTYTPDTTGWKPITIEYANPSGNASMGLRWRQGTASYVYPPTTNQSSGYGLATETVDADGNVTRTSYTDTSAGIDPKLGLPVSETTDPLGLNLTTRTSYETPGPGRYLRRVGRQLPTGAASQITTTYWGDTELASIPCPGGDTNVNQAGAVKRTTAADPDGTGPLGPIDWETVYDRAGRPAASRVVADGNAWTCITYDARGRATRTATPELPGQPGRVVEVDHRVGGNPLVTATTDTVGSGDPLTVQTTIDLLGRTRTYVDAWGHQTSTTYDQVGRIVETVDPVGTQTTRYDGDGNPGPTVLDGITLATPAYDGSGRLRSATYANGTSLDPITRDALGRETTQIWRAPGGAVLSSDEVTYSAGGDIVERRVDGQDPNPAGANYTYDAAGRLLDAWTTTIDATGAVSSIRDQYGYGLASSDCGPGTISTAGRNTNRTSHTRTPTGGAAVARSYCYDAADQLTATTTPGVGAISYDAHGNTTGIWGESRAYDATDRHLATANGPAGVTYRRDSTDRIIERRPAGGDPVRYGYTADGDTSDFTTTETGVVLERHIELPGSVLVTINGPSQTWSHANIHGDIAALTDGAGVKQGPTRTYDPYGNATAPLVDNSAGDLDYGWLGEHRRPTEHENGITDTIEMGARQYDPTLGRFLQVDPVEGGSANDYDYCNADSLNCTDLNGEAALPGRVKCAGVLGCNLYLNRRYTRMLFNARDNYRGSRSKAVALICGPFGISRAQWRKYVGGSWGCAKTLKKIRGSLIRSIASAARVGGCLSVRVSGLAAFLRGGRRDKSKQLSTGVYYASRRGRNCV